jgi:membrane protease YdiL (CAAX protease family)
VAFAFVVTFVFILMLFGSAVLGAVWTGETYGSIGGTMGRIISTAVLLTVLSRLGWLRSAGFTRLGRRRTWLILLLPLAYSIAASAYALTGNLKPGFSDLTLTGSVALFITTAAFLEEVAFRGLILHGFIRVWGRTNRGIIKGVLVSSLFFGSIHILDFIGGRPLLNVLLHSVEALFLGIFLGTLVLNGNSIYPAAFFHCILNLAGYLILGSKGLEPAPQSWLLFSVLMFPLALYGIYLLRNFPQRSVVPAAA